MIERLRIRGPLKLNERGRVDEIESALRQVYEWQSGPIDTIVVDSIDTWEWLDTFRFLRSPNEPGRSIYPGQRIVSYIDAYHSTVVRIEYATATSARSFDACWRI